MNNAPRVMLVGTGSGCGKTTATCGLLMALKHRGLNPTSFKCGPDYIDPMFHTEIINTPSRNLDLFLCNNENTVKYLFSANANGSDLSIIEGVMGMYDGIGTTDEFSSTHLARVLDTPQILVINPKGMSCSVGALVDGFLHYKWNNIRGVILNQTSEMMYKHFKQILDIPLYGYIPQVDEAILESRHLGLVTAGEVDNLKQKLLRLGSICNDTLDIDGIISLANKAAPLQYENIRLTASTQNQRVRVAVAMDKAFCFYYKDNLTLLERLGVDIVYFSPLKDTSLPDGISGLLLGGGYPEEYASQLSSNLSMLKSIRSAVVSGMPTIAECGGYMYLCESISDRYNNKYYMAGIILSEAAMTSKLSRFGYVTLTAKADNLLCDAGDSIHAHEFHYSDSSNNGSSFTAAKANGRQWSCIHADKTLFAGYPHIHLWGNIKFAERFVQAAAAYNKNARGSV